MINIKQAERYCCEDISLIENYDIAINSRDKYHCHHRLEIVDDNITSTNKLKSENLYWNRPAKELIFLKEKDHLRLHTTLRHNNGWSVDEKSEIETKFLSQIDNTRDYSLDKNRLFELVEKKKSKNFVSLI